MLVIHQTWPTPMSPPWFADKAAITPPWNAGLAPAQCHPAKTRAAVRHPKKRYQRRRIHWTHRDHRPWRPSPVTGVIHPAPVMERYPAPRRIINPGPLVVRVPHPTACAVRCPAIRHGIRHPDCPIFNRGTPVTVVIQITCTRNARRNVTLTVSIHQLIAALIIPAIPGNRLRSHISFGTPVRIHHNFFRRQNNQRLPVRLAHSRRPAPPCDEMHITIHIHTVITDTIYGKHRIGGRHFNVVTCHRQGTDIQ